MIASDDAVFFGDVMNEGWHLTNGRLFLCRRQEGKWENALVCQLTDFPESEIVDRREVASMSNILWIEPENWLPLDLPPNSSPSDGMEIMRVALAATRFRDQPDGLRLADKLLQDCFGKTHRDVYVAYRFG